MSQQGGREITPMTTPWLLPRPHETREYITLASEDSKHQSRLALFDHEGTDLCSQSAIYFLCVLGGAWGALQATYGAPNTAAPPAAHEGYGSANYAFQWDVDDSSSGNYYGHQEERDGGNTQGSYFVQLPDGRLMRVEYYVDDWGFHPTVTFEGEAKYQNTVDQGYGKPDPTPSSYYSQPGK
ncbi:pro-resilin-like [Penaeus vannamei]|uniref:pro-resilin-like n=1 Tax=Penaeus vannamei TaxID=6689 RepID=UPI00387FA3EF